MNTLNSWPPGYSKFTFVDFERTHDQLRAVALSAAPNRQQTEDFKTKKKLGRGANLSEPWFKSFPVKEQRNEHE